MNLAVAGMYHTGWHCYPGDLCCAVPLQQLSWVQRSALQCTASCSHV